MLTPLLSVWRERDFDLVINIRVTTYMGPHPDYGMKGGLLVTVYRLIAGREVRVLEQLAPVPAQSLDVLVVGLAQLPLETPVHGPVPAQSALLVVNTPGGSNSWSSASWHSSAPWRDRSSSSPTTTRLTPTIEPLAHLR